MKEQPPNAEEVATALEVMSIKDTSRDVTGIHLWIIILGVHLK